MTSTARSRPDAPWGVCRCGCLLMERTAVQHVCQRRSSALRLSIRSGAAWLRAKAREHNAASADPEDTAPMWPLALILCVLLSIGVVATVYALRSHPAPFPTAQ